MARGGRVASKPELPAPTPPMRATRREESSVQAYAILAILLVLAALSWASLAWDYPASTMDMTLPYTMGLSLTPFLLIWAVMMVAMMFPTAAPMILTFHKIQVRRTAHGAFFAVWAFVAGYLLLWALSGLAAFALARGAEAAAAYSAVSARSFARVGGAVLVLAGVYQFSPAKNFCLLKCRTPIAFIMASWRGGMTGALRMGWLHGLYCFGCCWLLFVILFPLGMMNVAAMAAITLLILAEKSFPWSGLPAHVSAVVLIAYGGAVIAMPELLPTFSTRAAMERETLDSPRNGDAPRSAAGSSCLDAISAAGTPRYFSLRREADEISRSCRIVAKADKHRKTAFD
jgi:predicted metal-binding membrane protein